MIKHLSFFFRSTLPSSGCVRISRTTSSNAVRTPMSALWSSATHCRPHSLCLLRHRCSPGCGRPFPPPHTTPPCRRRDPACLLSARSPLDHDILPTMTTGTYSPIGALVRLMLVNSFSTSSSELLCVKLHVSEAIWNSQVGCLAHWCGLWTTATAHAFRTFRTLTRR